MFLVPGQVKCICTIDPADAQVGQMQKLDVILFSDAKQSLFCSYKARTVRAMRRKWFTTTMASMACNALSITRSRRLFITNISKRKLKEEKKQPAMSRNKKAVRETVHSHRLMHIWHDSAVVSS